MLIRSLYLIRCGEVYVPTLWPAALNIPSRIATQEPLPLVPPTIIIFLAGLTRCLTPILELSPPYRRFSSFMFELANLSISEDEKPSFIATRAMRFNPSSISVGWFTSRRLNHSDRVFCGICTVTFSCICELSKQRGKCVSHLMPSYYHINCAMFE